MKRPRVLWMFAVLLIIVASAGCSHLVIGGAAGTGSAVYAGGQLSEDVNTTVPMVYEASVAALKERRLPVIEDSHNDVMMKITTRLADGTDVWVSGASISNGSSRIAVRVGVDGNKHESKKILASINKRLSWGWREEKSGNSPARGFLNPPEGSANALAP